MITEPPNLTPHGLSRIDVILTTAPRKSSSSRSVNVGLSDSHNKIYSTPRLPPKTITYRNYKCFQEDLYIEDVKRIPVTACQIFDDPTDNFWALQTLLTDVINEHAPLKTVRVRAIEVPFCPRQNATFQRVQKTSNPTQLGKVQRNLTVTIRRDAIRSYFNNKCSTGAKNTDFWPTIKPFLTNKGATCDNTIMLRVDEKIITDASQISQHMNKCYVNIASTKDNSLKTTPVLPQRWAVWNILTKNDWRKHKRVTENRNKCRFRLEVRRQLRQTSEHRGHQ